MADTMAMGAVTCAVLYVDANIGGGAGAGDTPATALANIPAVTALASNTVYLIRRNVTQAVTLTNGTLATGNNIFLIGMPLSTDWLYERVPAAAIAAWDADVPTYALANTAAYNTSFCLNPIDRCGFHRLKISRVNPTGGSGLAYTGSPMQLDVRASYATTEYVTNGEFFFTNCWWCDAYAKALSDPTWLTNTANESGGMQFCYARSVVFNDNIIEHHGRYNQYPSNNPTYAIYFNNVRHLACNDNEFWWSSCGQTSWAYHFLAHTVSYYYLCDLEFSRNNLHLVCQDFTYVYFGTCLQFAAKDAYSHNCSITVDRYYNRSAITSGCYFGYGYYLAAGTGTYGKWDIQNITVDSGDICNISGYLVYLDQNDWGAHAYSAVYPSSVIKDISAKCASTGGIASSYAGSAMFLQLGAECTPVEDITAWHYMGTGLYCLSRSDNEGYMKGPVGKNFSVRGLLTCWYWSFLHVTSWTLGSVPGTSKLYVKNATVYIETATIDPGNAWGVQNWLYYYNTSRVVIDQIDVSPYVYWYNNGAYDNCVLINNVDGVTGKWWGSNNYYMGRSWNVYRSGGANASIKMTSPGASDMHWTALPIAPSPFRGLEWTPAGTGPATATIHFAHKLMTNPTYLLKRISVQLLVPYWDGDLSEYQPRMVLGDVQGALLDASDETWNNDPGLTQVKLVIPFTVTAAGQVVTLRLAYDWYDVTGYCYIDPVVEFAGAEPTPTPSSTPTPGPTPTPEPTPTPGPTPTPSSTPTPV